jgi:uncharacterized protein
MATVTELIPAKVLHQFLREHGTFKNLTVALCGAHAFGYSQPRSPFELKGLHVVPTENLLGLKAPAKTINWVGEYQGFRIDYSSCEIGTALKQLLKGDGSILERALAPRQLIKGEDLRTLQKVSRGVISRQFFHHYRTFSRGVLRDFEEDEPRTVRHLLGAYRQALTGVHLLLTGKVILDLPTLAQKYGFVQVQELIALYQERDDAILKENHPAINRLVKLHTLLEKAMEGSPLRIEPEDPPGVEGYLIDMRRRFFDAPTVQQG